MAHAGIELDGDIFFACINQVIINLFDAVAVCSYGVVFACREKHGNAVIKLVVPVLARNFVENREKVFVASGGEKKAAIFIGYVFVNLFGIG